MGKGVPVVSPNLVDYSTLPSRPLPSRYGSLPLLDPVPLQGGTRSTSGLSGREYLLLFLPTHTPSIPSASHRLGHHPIMPATPLLPERYLTPNTAIADWFFRIPLSYAPRLCRTPVTFVRNAILNKKHHDGEPY